MFDFEIKNFKSIKSLKIYEPSKNIISLIGPTDSGKTNILQSIEKFENKIINFEKKDFLHTNKNTKPESFKPIEINLKFSFRENRINDKIEKFLDKYKAKFKELGLENLIKNSMPSNNKVLETHKVQYEIKISQTYGEDPQYDSKDFTQLHSTKSIDFLFSQITKIWKKLKLSKIWKCEKPQDLLRPYEYPQNNLFIQYMSQKYDHSDMIIDLVDIFIFLYHLKFKEPKIKKIGSKKLFQSETTYSIDLLAKENLDNEQIKNRENLKKWIKLLEVKEQDLKDACDASKEIDQRRTFSSEIEKRFNSKIKKINKFLGFKSNLELKVTLNLNQLDIYFDWAQEKEMVHLDNAKNASSGNKKIILMILEIWAIKKYEPTIIIIDEPESNLNPIYQQKFLEFLAKQSKQDNKFIIYATHSPFMLGHNYGFSNRIIYRNKLDNSTESLGYYEQIDKEKIGESDLNAMDLTVTDFTELLYYKTINKSYDSVLLVEGFADKEMLDKILKHNKIKNVLVIQLKGFNGIREIEKIKKRLVYFFCRKSVKAIFDNDHNGKIFYDELKNELSSNNLKFYSDLSSDNVKSYSDKPSLESNNNSNYKLEDFLGIDYKITYKNIDKIKLDFTRFDTFIKYIETTNNDFDPHSNT